MRDDARESGLRRDRFLLAATLLVALGHLLYVLPALPERVASHFDSSGRPDGWTDRASFGWTMAVSYLASGGLFLVLASVLPRFPDSMINVPNREHWLAPERRAQTLALVARRLLRLGAVTVLFVLALTHQTAQVNLRHAEGLDGLWMAVAAYLLYTLVWSVGLLRTFRVPPAGGSGT